MNSDDSVGTDTFTNITNNGEVSIRWRHPALAILLLSFCVLTVAGNCLVVLAVCTKKYLRNPTGYLIISLAIADLIVGLVVMPLNSLFEMTNHVWILGLTMCDIFHALDILASTSSIWNLCVISLDRYMAGRDPIGYRDKVSKQRIRLAICLVWIGSASLAFPAIAWWRISSPHLYENSNQCLFTDSATYVGFSSLVSFYIPLCLILFAYGKVFLIATRHSRGMKRGLKKVKCKNTKKTESESMLSEDPGPSLRIHFGHSNKKDAKGKGNKTAGMHTSRLLLKQVSCRSLIDTRDGTSITSPLLGPLSRPPTTSLNNGGRTSGMNCSLELPRANSSVSMISVHKDDQSDVSTRTAPVISTTVNCMRNTSDVQTTKTRGQNGRKKMGVREKSRQMMKYVHEQRAARTLSIVVGAFILCWTPFFIFSPIFTLCESCVENKDTLFAIFTWAGHLNSMLNPLIYSRFSRDFRRAFKQLLTCQRERKVKSAIKTPLSLVFTQLISITQFWEQPIDEP